MLKEQITNDIKESMKAGDSFKTGVLRMMSAAFSNKEIENRGKGKTDPLSEEELIDILSREAKKRKEAADVYRQGNREELAEKEDQELAVIKNYLPEPLSKEELENIITQAIAKTGAATVKDMGKVMAEISAKIKGKADAKEVSEIIKSKLGNV